MLGRGMSQIDDALSQDDPAGGTVGEIGRLRRHLRGEPKCVRRAGACNLQLRTGLPCQRLGDIVRSWRKQAKLRMDLRKIIKASRKTPELPPLTSRDSA